MRLKYYKQLLLAIYKQTRNDLEYNYKHYLKHSESTLDIQYSELRMYCHMLDKGLNNISFEKGHSLDIYRKAMVLQDKLYLKYGNEREYEWIKKILKRYEDAQEYGKPRLSNQEIVQYSDNQVEEYTSFIMRRTSCRNFMKKAIHPSILKRIVAIAIDAPNGCCRQSVRYYFTQDKVKIDMSVSHIAGITNFSNIQCLVCVAAESSYYGLIDKNLQYIDVAVSAENFMLGASLYGVYGTMCNFFHATKEDIQLCKRIFSIKETETIVMFIAMGYPVSIPEKPARRDIEVFYKEL